MIDQKYTTGDIIDVKIEKIVPRGFGLGFADGLTVLVPLSAPGDCLRVRIQDIKKRLAFAEIVEILQGGRSRIVPPCPYVGTCGGCDFQQMAYDAQLEAKVGIIRDCLHRIGKIDYDKEIAVIPSPQPFGYRSRARWQVARRSRSIGYFAGDSHDVVNIAECPILTPEMAAVFQTVRKNIDWETFGTDRPEIEAAADENGSVSIDPAALAEKSAELNFAVNGTTYTYSSKVFFQANASVIPELIDAAIAGAGGEMAFDLYSGVGLFSIPLAKSFKTVVAVEDHPAAVEFAKRNVSAARLDNVKVVEKRVDKFLAKNKTTNIDLLLLDPPRSGTEKETIAAVADLKPRQISYVSCEPSTLARDLRILIDAGYTIEKLIALDMFPQTHHVETVARLSAI